MIPDFLVDFNEETALQHERFTEAAAAYLYSVNESIKFLNGLKMESS